MAEMSKVRLVNGTEVDIKDAAAREDIAALKKVGSGISVQYTATLLKSGWTSSTKGGSVVYTYNLPIPELTCGTTGQVSPIISYTSNVTDYSYIEEAEATPKVGITFTTNTKVSDDINIIIIDVK